MSLRFYFGPSGSGKSHRIYEEIMQRAAQEPGRNFLIIVPDQFTMQTLTPYWIAFLAYSNSPNPLKITITMSG